MSATGITGGWLSGALQSAFDWLLPPLCLGCRRSQPAIDDFNLCPRCRGRCRPATGRRCPGCLVRVVDRSGDDLFLCGACRRRPPNYSRILAGWAYEPPFEAVVTGLKFGRLEYLGEALGRTVARRWPEALAEATSVVPVPLHPVRLVRRGYNQARRIAEGVAAELSGEGSVPLVPALRRRRRTAPQTGLDRKGRRRNVRGAFVVRRGKRWRERLGARPVVVDDVMTTGATLDSAARALRRVGGVEVMGVVAAFRPEAGVPPRFFEGE